VVGTDVINRAGQNTIADLTALQPILQNLIASGDALPGSLQILLTIPFADNSLNVIKGDFANIDVTVEISLQGLLQNLLGVNPAAGNLNQIFALLQNQQTARATGNPLIALPGITGANTGAAAPTTTTTTGTGTPAAPAAAGGGTGTTTGTGTGTGTTGTTGGGATGSTGSTQGEGN
jgi:phospholipid/cholesterol/gamma-HCH transport system substrate-binding protein